MSLTPNVNESIHSPVSIVCPQICIWVATIWSLAVICFNDRWPSLTNICDVLDMLSREYRRKTRPHLEEAPWNPVQKEKKQDMRCAARRKARGQKRKSPVLSNRLTSSPHRLACCPRPLSSLYIATSFRHWVCIIPPQNLTTWKIQFVLFCWLLCWVSSRQVTMTVAIILGIVNSGCSTFTHFTSPCNVSWILVGTFSNLLFWHEDDNIAYMLGRTVISFDSSCCDLGNDI